MVNTSPSVACSRRRTAIRFWPSSAWSIRATFASDDLASRNDFSEFESPSIHSTSKLSGISSISGVSESTIIFSGWFLWLISSKHRLMNTWLSELIKMCPSIPISSIPITSIAFFSRSPFGLDSVTSNFITELPSEISNGSSCIIKLSFGISNEASGLISTTSFITTARGIIPWFCLFVFISSSQVLPICKESVFLVAIWCPWLRLITLLIHAGAPCEWKADSIIGT